jgi:hypothetical protein
MITILDGMNAARDMFGELYYKDMDSVVAFLNEQAVCGPRDFLPFLQECAENFPLLNGAAIEYCEITGQAIGTSDLCTADQEQLRLQCAFPCMVYLGEPPKLFVTERFRQLERKDQIVGMNHELVHLEQFVRGDTYLVGTGTQVWKGEEYGNVGLIQEGQIAGDPAADLAYLGLPWEREAIERSEGVESYREKLRSTALRTVVRQRLTVPDAHPYMEDLVMEACLLLIRNAIEDSVGSDAETREGIECGKEMAYLLFELTGHQGTVLWEMLLKNDDGQSPLDSAYPVPYVDKLVKTAESVLLRTIREQPAPR